MIGELGQQLHNLTCLAHSTPFVPSPLTPSLQAPRAQPNATLGENNIKHDLEHDLDHDLEHQPGHSRSSYTGVTTDQRVSRIAQRRGSCSTMLLNELNPHPAGTAVSSPRVPPYSLAPRLPKNPSHPH